MRPATAIWLILIGCAPPVPGGFDSDSGAVDGRGDAGTSDSATSGPVPLSFVGAKAEYGATEPALAIDGDEATCYQSGHNAGDEPDGVQWWQGDLGATTEVSSLAIVWEALGALFDVEAIGSNTESFDGGTVELMPRGLRMADGSSWSASPNAFVRYVRIQYYGTEDTRGFGLGLCEVTAIGVVP